MPDVFTLSVRALTSPTPTTRRLVLDLAGAPFAYRAGQAAAIGLHGQRERRPYSIASAPADTATTGALEFLLRTDPAGGLGRHLDAVRPGARVDFEGPFGAFVLPEDLPDAPLLLVAGGTGIAPLRGIAREARARGHRAPRHLVYSVRVPDDIAYSEELASWRGDHGGDAIVTVTRGNGEWQGRRGRPDAALLRDLVDHTSPLCFLCGPAAMVDELSHALWQMGVPSDHVRTEQWTPAV